MVDTLNIDLLLKAGGSSLSQLNYR